MTKLDWIPRPGQGKLAIAARPRGSDWLDSEMPDWKNASVNALLSRLTPDEERDLDLAGEKHRLWTKDCGLRRSPFPVGKFRPHHLSSLRHWMRSMRN